MRNLARTDADFLVAVAAEIERARGLFPEQERAVSFARWYAIVGEEVGEIARDLNAPTDGKRLDFDHLEIEIIQAAAMLGRMFAAVRVQR